MYGRVGSGGGVDAVRATGGADGGWFEDGGIAEGG